MTSIWPGEWASHQESIVIWPGREQVWQPHLHHAEVEFSDLILTVAAHEPVRVIARPDHRGLPVEVGSSAQVTVSLIPTDDCWARDIAPVFVLDGPHEVAVDLGFNAWGGKFSPYGNDAAFAQRIAAYLGIPLRKAPFISEGGAIDVDGCGTALVVETSVLNENRNPNQSRRCVEEALHDLLGIEVVIWLPHGLIDDPDTDGHVDNVARFVGPGTVVCQAAGHDPDETERLGHNLRLLRRSRDALGRQLTVIEVPWLPYSSFTDRRPSSYCNFYIVNGGVLVPTLNAPTDEDALQLIQKATGRPATGVGAHALAYGGGGPHCVVMPRFSTPTLSTDIERIQDVI